MKSFDRFLKEETKQLVQYDLPYAKTDLQPVMSKKTLDYHYSALAKGYIDRFNKKEGDPVFNEAGAFLHNIFFAQFQRPSVNNKPLGASKDFIVKNYRTFNIFKDEVEKVAMKIQGSGWVYLAKDGSIKTIKNHEIKKDIVLLIDWWEHAWALDYQADKKQYLKNIWSIINWNVVNAKLV